MTGEKGRGALLYGVALTLLAAGAVWWFAAAPEERTDPRIEGWRSSAERLLPKSDNQEDDDTVALMAGVDHEVLASVAGRGQFTVSVVCVGDEESMVRVSLGEFGRDSGRGLPCADDGHAPTSFPVSIVGQLRMNVSVSENGPVVFRYTVTDD